MSCIATMVMVKPAAAAAAAVQSPAAAVLLHPSAVLMASMKSKPGGHAQLGCASRSRTQ
jgi:hypothetical protein